MLEFTVEEARVNAAEHHVRKILATSQDEAELRMCRYTLAVIKMIRDETLRAIRLTQQLAEAAKALREERFGVGTPALHLSQLLSPSPQAYATLYSLKHPCLADGFD